MRTLACLLVSFGLIACGEPDGSGDGGLDDAAVPDLDGGERDGGGVDAGTDAGGGEVHDGGRDDDAGPPCGCDDSIECTRDVCTATGCVYEPVHRRCEPGWFCGESGCEPGGACATDAECPSDGDACTQNMRCDLAASQCTWEILDGDGDGYAPLVCGGEDCADATPGVNPDGVEVCNGVDDDCDGVVDGPAATEACGFGLLCDHGECVCPSGQSWCGELLGCRVVTGDPLACGTCETACARSGELCDTGTCVCPGGTAECSDACADLATSTDHCGACENACVAGAVCDGGTCACPAGTSECSVGCVPLQTDPDHCGTCDVRCIDGASCGGGTCSSTVPFLRGFQTDASTRASIDADVIGHPSGEMTLLIRYAPSLDELPFRAIDGGDYYHRGAYLSRRSSTGAELWGRILPSDLELVGAPGREEFAVVGRISPSYDFGTGPIGGLGTPVGIARYDAGGSATWTRAISVTDASYSSPQLVEAAMHDDGSVSVAVALNDPADFGGAVHGSTACCTRRAVARYAAADGARLASWGLPVIGSNGVGVGAIGAGPSGSVVVAGTYSGGAVTFGSTILPGPSGTYVATYDASGTATAAFNAPGGGFSYSGTLGVASDGDVYLSTGGLRLARFAPTGMIRWSYLSASSGGSSAWVYGIEALPGGRLFVWGRQSGHADLGAGPFRRAEGYYGALYEGDGTLVKTRAIETGAPPLPTRVDAMAHVGSDTWAVTGDFDERMVLQDHSIASTQPPSYSYSPEALWFAAIAP